MESTNAHHTKVDRTAEPAALWKGWAQRAAKWTAALLPIGPESTRLKEKKKDGVKQMKEKRKALCACSYPVEGGESQVRFASVWRFFVPCPTETQIRVAASGAALRLLLLRLVVQFVLSAKADVLDGTLHAHDLFLRVGETADQTCSRKQCTGKQKRYHSGDGQRGAVHTAMRNTRQY